MKNNKHVAAQYIILDTCIIQYILTDYLANSLIGLFEKLINNGFGISISNITIFENLRSSNILKEKELFGLYESLYRYIINEQVLILSARLHNIYKQEKNINDNSISYGDLIIAATSILTGSLIITGDCNDFPRPIFNEKYKENVFYKKKNKDNILNIFLLEPDYRYLNHHLRAGVV